MYNLVNEPEHSLHRILTNRPPHVVQKCTLFSTCGGFFISMPQKAYKFRLYPNKTQEISLSKTFGCVRLFWNHCVASFRDKVSEESTTEFRNSSDRDFMLDVSAAAIQQKHRDYLEFKKQKFNKSRKKQLGNPSFKKKNDKQSFRLPNQKFTLGEDRIRLEKIGWVKIVKDRDIPENAKFVNVTVSRNRAGQYFASILIDESIEEKKKTGKGVGIDVGLEKFLTIDNGDFVENPRYFGKNQAKLARLQKIQSNKVGSKKGQKKSRRWLKMQKKINKLYQTITNQRDHFLHEVTTELVNNYDFIAIEDLAVQEMMQDSYIAKSIADVSWARFFNFLEYKCQWYGKKLVKVDRYAPTSKTCSGCGYRFKGLTLEDRVVECPTCGSMDRDQNAAKNILALGVDSALRTPRGV